MSAIFERGQTMRIRLSLNGETMTAETEVRSSAADFLRDVLQLTGTHVSCEEGQCGACSIKIDGNVVRSCLTLAVQLDGTTVQTLEGVAPDPWVRRLQETFYERAALQCGFCTGGMLLTSAELLRRHPKPSRDAIRAYLAGNYCRCTGYEAIVDAVEQAARLGPAPERDTSITDFTFIQQPSQGSPR